MSAAATSTLRTLLLSMILILLVRETIPRQIGVLGITDSPVRNHRRRHRPDQKFKEVLVGVKGREDNEAPMMADDVTEKRSVSGASTPFHLKTITNKNSMTLFYERNEFGTPIIKASNKTPNASSQFHISQVCSDHSMKHVRKLFKCTWALMEHFEQGLYFKVVLRNPDVEYVMCVRGRKARLRETSTIKKVSQAQRCIWKWDEIEPKEENAVVIYAKYRNGCELAKNGTKRVEKKCGKDKKAYLTIKSAGRSGKVMLRYIRKPKETRRITDESKFFLQTVGSKSNFNADLPNLGFPTLSPNTEHTSLVDNIQSEMEKSDKKNRNSRRKKYNRDNLLQTDWTEQRRTRRKQKTRNLLKQRHRKGMTDDMPVIHKSMVDNK